MDVTCSRISLCPDTTSNLMAHASVVFDSELVVHGVKVVRTQPTPECPSRLIICFPSHGKWTNCPECFRRTEETNHYCGRCGAEIPRPATPGRYTDLVHPLCTSLREKVAACVMEAYEHVKFNGGHWPKTKDS